MTGTRSAARTVREWGARTVRLVPGAAFLFLPLVAVPAPAQPLTTDEYTAIASRTFECTTKKGVSTLHLGDLVRDRVPADAFLNFSGLCPARKADVIASFKREDLAHAADLLDQWCSAQKGYALRPGADCAVGYQKCVSGHWEETPEAEARWTAHLAEVRAARAARVAEVDGEAGCAPFEAAGVAPREDCGGMGPCGASEDCRAGLCVARNAQHECSGFQQSGEHAFAWRVCVDRDANGVAVSASLDLRNDEPGRRAVTVEADCTWVGGESQKANLQLPPGATKSILCPACLRQSSRGAKLPVCHAEKFVVDDSRDYPIGRP